MPTTGLVTDARSQRLVSPAGGPSHHCVPRTPRERTPSAVPTDHAAAENTRSSRARARSSSSIGHRPQRVPGQDGGQPVRRLGDERAQDVELDGCSVNVSPDTLTAPATAPSASSTGAPRQRTWALNCSSSTT